MIFNTILFETREDTAIITFNRPRQKNAISPELSEEMGKAVDLAVENNSVRFIVITGTETVFSSGADMSNHEKAVTMILSELNINSGSSPIAKLINCPKPTIAAVNGYALGHGAEYAIMCDIIIASDLAEFGFIGPIRGVTCPYAMIRLADEIGRAKAKELMFTCDRISAQEALKIGLINNVVPHEQLMGAVFDLVERMRRAGPLASRYTKEVINRKLDGYDISARIFGEIVKSADAAEGALAFFEKRDPEWTS
ncbi:MAG: enoyl-CoA hydratase/isomerase family protein [Syntrophales bacterium]|jgi:enoyl-CoA hydratase|nr:enoyl-CoA hydratase/isomerase family protein [Syntrophales bacterium]MDY0043566.1 enoyl-CoA hydratase/isomerase family protein [Syntrophales bacterium]